ncbi:CLIP domain-containing serine protease B4-like [Diachasmimorpha longicaudata]|uniref:CLIP domain-containing serine protease B4-like n=1 Tax=Diachasmimorpha longicaudata TaxID=58733 RepID=UPI0030B90CC5
MAVQTIISIIKTFGISVLCLSIGVISASIPSAGLQDNKTEFAALFGGRYARLGQFPWMAVIHQLITKRDIAMCSGSVISERWILTAGHCIANNPQRFLVVLGDVDKRNIVGTRYEGPGVAMITKKSVLHPQYEEFVCDIGLLYMPRDIKFGGNIQQIALAGSSYLYKSVVGRKALIAGWGQTGSHKSLPKLKWGELQIMSNEDCSAFWDVDDEHFCTEAMMKTDTCSGDSGSPLMLGTNDDPIVIGVVSYGDRFCPSSAPGVFTRVSSYIGWIRKVTRKRL